MKFIRRFATLRVSILSIVLIAWLIPTVVLGSTVAGLFMPALRERNEQALESGVEYAASVVKDNVERLITLAKDVTYDGELTMAYSSYKSGAWQYSDFYRVCRNYLERRFSRNPMIRRAIFFTVDEPDRMMFTSGGETEIAHLMPHGLMDIRILGETLDTLCRFVYKNDRLYLVRNLYDNRLERFGMLILGINENELFSAVTEGAGTWQAETYVKLGEYESASPPPLDSLETGLSVSSGYLNCSVIHLDRDYDLMVLVRQSIAVLDRQNASFARVLALLIALLIPVCALVMYFVHKRVVRPITLLSDCAGRIEAGELGVSVPMRGPDEIGRLGNAFSHMSVRLKEMVDKEYKAEIALRDAELKALQSRIDPHFLNNALELINWQARLDGASGICFMVDALSVLMNAALARDGRSMAPVREELDVARAYIFFVSRRFGDKLRYDEDVDETLLTALLPRMTIQTLLENAVEHGVAQASGGMIRLNVRRDGDMLVLEVENTGKCLSDGDEARIQALIDAGGSQHVGLGNIKARLGYLFGESARLRLFRADNGRTVARVIAPIECNERHFAPMTFK